MQVDPRRNVSMFEYYYALLRGGYYSKFLGVLLNTPLSLRNIIRAVDNWYEVVLNYPMLFRGQKKVTLRLRDGTVRTASKRENLSEIVSEYLARQAVAQARRLYGVDLSFLANEYAFVETFYHEFYRDLDVKGKIVIDVGAYVGDTAIYFLLRGARHVYAIEPNHIAIRIAMENVRRLGLEGRVTFINAAVGSKIGEIRIKPDASIEAGADIGALRSDSGVPVKVVTLRWLVEEYGLEDAVLKMDCEGCEYDSILHDDVSVLRAFKEMVIEYHYGYRCIVQRLRDAGFRVRYSRPWYSYNTSASNPHMFVGLIYAVRK